jgi:carboxyl-terminal processing protease
LTAIIYLMQNLFKKYSIQLLAIAIVLSFGAGFLVGEKNPSQISQVSGIDNKESDISANTDFSTFWKVWNILNEKYVPTHSTTTPTNQQKVYGAIQGLTASYGDPYTIFFPPVDSKNFNDQISGSFEGVGMEIDVKDGNLTVVAPLKGTPSYKAGVKAGDKIIRINKKITTGLSTEQAVALIKGPKGSTVVLSIIRGNSKEPMDISIVRDVISVPTIDTETKGDVFVIHLYTFTATSPNLFRNALREFVESGKNKMVLDLRGNPGGYLEAAVDMASWFLPAGDVVVSEKSKDPKNNQDYRSRGYNIFNENLKMAILMDQGSASASEILSGALSEQGVATLIGTRSYGKGSVQELVPITSDTSLKVTVAKWYTPKDHSISDGGLTPDIKVDLDVAKFAKGEDTQMETAVNFLDGITPGVAGQATTTAKN